MLPFRKILFPVDYSRHCDAVVPYVKEALGRFKAELTLVHAYGPENLHYDEIMVADRGWPQAVHLFEKNRLETFASTAFPGQRADLRIAAGEPGTVIREVVDREGTDLVMMPTRGQGPVRRLLLGSVTAKVLHDLNTAVWTSADSEKEARQPQAPYQSILCALDETEEAEVVLRAAANLARSYSAQLFLVTVVLTPPAAPEMNVTFYLKELEEAAHVRLREMKSKLDITAPHKVATTSVVDAIRDEVRDRSADLLVVGRGNAQMTFGRLWSSLYSIIRETPCPVLSI